MVAPCLAAFPEYRAALREALLERKLRHWDRDLRALAAAALGGARPDRPRLGGATRRCRQLRAPVPGPCTRGAATCELV